MNTKNAADLILHNGHITTLDPNCPEAKNVAIKDGRIVGLDDAESYERGPNTTTIDLKGRRVIPGLNDSHLHVIRGGLNYNMELRWDGVPSLADALRMLQRTGGTHTSRSMGARCRRLVRVPVCRTKNAHIGGSQCRCSRDTRLHPAPLFPSPAEQGRAARMRLYEGHAQPTWRGNSARQQRQSYRAPPRPPERRDSLRYPGQGSQAAARTPDE